MSNHLLNHQFLISDYLKKLSRLEQEEVAQKRVCQIAAIVVASFLLGAYILN